MFKEKFQEILDDLGGRFKNPLILSFIIVWGFQHWELIFIIFNFDKDFLLDDKIFKIKEYISDKKFNKLFLIPLGYSFASLTLFYLIGITATAIQIWIGKRLMAATLAWSDRGRYELKTISDKYKRQSKELKMQVGQLEDEASAFKEKTNAKDLSIFELNKRINTMEADISDFNEIKTAKENLEKNIAEIQGNLKNIEIENTSLVQKNDTLEKEFDRMQTLGGYSNSIQTDSDNLENIFGLSTIWDVFLNDNKIESIRYNGNSKVMVTSKGSIKITDIKISEKHGLIIFDKNTPRFQHLTNTLIKYDDNTLIGTEGTNRIKYVRTKKLIL